MHTSDSGIPAAGICPRRITFYFDGCSMLHLHIRLHIHHVLSRLAHHLRLRLGVRVRSVRHHRHLSRMTDLRCVALVSVYGVRCGSLLLCVGMLWRRLMVHRDAHVSLIVRRMRRRVRCWCPVACHLHGLGSDKRGIIQRIRHGSRIALHAIRSGVRLNGVNGWVICHGAWVMLRMRRWVRTPACVMVRR